MVRHRTGLQSPGLPLPGRPNSEFGHMRSAGNLVGAVLPPPAGGDAASPAEGASRAARRGRGPTGFAAAVRIVFEHLDPERRGRIRRAQVIPGRAWEISLVS